MPTCQAYQTSCQIPKIHPQWKLLRRPEQRGVNLTSIYLQACCISCKMSDSSSHAQTGGFTLTCFVAAMSRNDPDRQYLPAMKSMWDTVDRLWQPAQILTDAGHHLCQAWAARASHPEFPYAVHMLALMCPLTNGGRVAIFPTAPSPLVAFTITCNYAQTRKSSMTSHSDQVMKPLDDLIREKVQSQLAAEGHPAARPQCRTLVHATKFEPTVVCSDSKHDM